VRRPSASARSRMSPTGLGWRVEKVTLGATWQARRT